MSVISTQFDFKGEHHSPAIPDFMRQVHYDEKGHEVVTWEPVDYPSFTKSLGIAEDWSLDSLMKAGINPDFGIHTGEVSRIESAAIVQEVAAEIEDIVKKSNKAE